MKTYALSLLFLLFPAPVLFAGIISGKVTDATNGEEIPGVGIHLKDLKRAATTDVQGIFRFYDVPAGTYELVVSFIGYKTSTVTNVVVTEKGTTEVSVAIKEEGTELDMVEITATMEKHTVGSMLLFQQRTHTITTGVTGDDIRKSPDKNTGEVLRRVSGASIQDNKFVLIRGLSDRYNLAMVNGSMLPSTEPDRKAFSFDIFPSSILDNLVIYKTAAPDLPGNFAGGIIELNTRDIPSKGFVALSLGGSYNSISTFKEYMSYGRSTNGWYTSELKDRAMPEGLPDTDTLRTLLNSPQHYTTYTKMFDYDWNYNTLPSSPVGKSIQLSFGDRFKIKNSALGFTGAALYSESRKLKIVTRQDYDVDTARLYSYDDRQYQQLQTTGALFNLSWNVGSHSSFYLKNMISLIGEDNLIYRYGPNFELDRNDSAFAFIYNFTRLISSQLGGEHVFGKRKMRIKWNAGYSQTGRSTPDLRKMVYTRNFGDTIAYAYIPLSVPSPNYGGRFWSELNETVFSGQTDLSIPVKWYNQKHLVRGGLMMEQRDRAFNARVFGYVLSSPMAFGLLSLPMSEIFQEENMSAQGIHIEEATNPSDSYTAKTSMMAGYGMMEQSFGKLWKATWGVRAEYYLLSLHSAQYDGSPVTIDTAFLDILPSLNITYSLTEKSNFRFAASRTLVRPELRELAPFSFYDFSSATAVVGNDTLSRTRIWNGDIKYEWFPGYNQLFAVSVFGKYFVNPIEMVAFYGGSGSRTRSYQNAPSAVSLGAELEYRVKLTWLDSLLNTRIFSNVSWFANLAYIRSGVNLDGVKNTDTAEQFRPMQGQSPFVINTGLMYLSEKTGWGASLLFNKIGRRIHEVGAIGYQDIYESSGEQFDVQVSKAFWKAPKSGVRRGEIKLSVSNILNDKPTYYQDFNLNKRFDGAGTDKVIQITQLGTQYSLSLSLKF
ncbi:MAG: carboxypeptidase-like regulatory domain-containing protein [Bacteroidia bacterium]|nr:carboxypeptidase-like regulatory domain-containing protein [Bacteroidia bacterium]